MKTLLYIWHTWVAGHPIKDCKAIDPLYAECKCGEIIGLVDFY